MKREFILTIVGVSVVLLSFIGAPAYARGGSHGAGGGFSGGRHAGFSAAGHTSFGAGGHASGVSHGYSGAGISHGAGGYRASQYALGISSGRYGGYSGYGQSHYAPRTSTGNPIYRSSPSSQSRSASRQFARSPKYSGSYYVPRDQSAIGFARKPGIQQRAGTTAKGATRPGNTLSRQNPVNTHRLDPQTKQRLRNWQGKAPGWNDAKRNHHDNWRDRHHHDHNWWHRYCPAIVLVGSGYWGWYDGWWYPALGYDSYYSDYDYNGPIYGYDGLQPDEVIANVQAALQQLGYYAYTVDGVLGSATEAAIANYQRDNGLPVTGAIDPVTVRSLGLSS
jgi:hypothetical protein